MATSKRRISQRIGYAFGSAIIAGSAAILLLGAASTMRMPGPANTGHEQLACESCHRSAPGTFRQQAQANIRWILGLRAESVELGALPVATSACTECHVRPDDRHPIYRFSEARFTDARKAMKLERCASCHTEHTGKRVTAPLDYCRNCHAELALARDPVDFSHEMLVRMNQWESCLGCHDFHGNHNYPPPTQFSAIISAETLYQYFGGSTSPYGPAKSHATRR